MEAAPPQFRPDGDSAERELWNVGAKRLGCGRWHRLLLRVLSQSLRTSRPRPLPQPLQQGEYNTHFHGTSQLVFSFISFTVMAKVVYWFASIGILVDVYLAASFLFQGNCCPVADLALT